MAACQRSLSKSAPGSEARLTVVASEARGRGAENRNAAQTVIPTARLITIGPTRRFMIRNEISAGSRGVTRASQHRVPDSKGLDWSCEAEIQSVGASGTLLALSF